MSTNDDRTARLAGVRERLRTATPGPWDWRLADTLHDEGPILAGRALLASEVHRHDAALIANAPADLAFLLALVDKQAAALDNACDYRAEHAAAWAALGDAPGGDLAEAIGWVVAKVREKAAEIARLRQGLWDCAGDAGADLDGQATPDALVQPDLVAFARREVQALREAYGEVQAEVEAGREREAALVVAKDEADEACRISAQWAKDEKDKAARARAEERAAVVADLRGSADLLLGPPAADDLTNKAMAGTLRLMAARYERGEHLPAPAAPVPPGPARGESEEREKARAATLALGHDYDAIEARLIATIDRKGHRESCLFLDPADPKIAAAAMGGWYCCPGCPIGGVPRG